MKYCFGIIYVFSTFSDIYGLSWSKSYNLKAVLRIPSADIEEPYEIWADGETGETRIDFYNGLDKIYKLRDSPTSFLYYKIHPESFENGLSRDVCNIYKASNSVISSTKQHYLPEQNFKFIGTERVDNIETQKWIHERAYYSDELYFTYIFTVWVKLENSVTIPVRFDYLMTVDGKEVTFNRHDYIYFESSAPDPEVFDLPFSINCKIRTAEKHEQLDPIMEYVNPELEDVRISEAFGSFVLEHNKNYKDSKEYRHRQNIFKNNLRLINSVNRQHQSYSLAMNQFTDLSDLELARLNRLHVSPTNFSHHNDEDDHVDDDNENYISNDNKYFDWRDYDAITPIKDQTLLCGSCYAFTTAATVESAMYIHKGCKDMVEFSEQAIVDCSWRSAGNELNSGCDYGNLSKTLFYIKKYGIATKQSYGPYLAMEGICRMKTARKYKIRSFSKLSKNKKEIKKALRKNGPLAISINGSPKTFMFYSKGVYNNKKCANGDIDLSHGMTLIGYGVEAGKDYWILKNSYGTNWGEKGFMRISTESNLCGAMNDVYAVQFKKKSDINSCVMKINVE